MLTIASAVRNASYPISHCNNIGATENQITNRLQIRDHRLISALSVSEKESK